MRLALALLAVLAGCKPSAPKGAAPELAYAPPSGKRAFSLALDKSQTQFLEPGDAVEFVVMAETRRPDGGSDTRAEPLAAKAEVLRVDNGWADDTGLVALALSPEETQFAALAVQREDRLFLNKLAGEPAKLAPRPAPGEPPRLETGLRGLSVLVHPDQERFLEPGDRVDVVASRQGWKAGGKNELTALTLIQDALVLRVEAPAGSEEWSTVQLMLDEKQAASLARAVAGEDDLTLAIRPPGERGARPIEPARMSRKLGFEAEHANPKS